MLNNNNPKSNTKHKESSIVENEETFKDKERDFIKNVPQFQIEEFERELCPKDFRDHKDDKEVNFDDFKIFQLWKELKNNTLSRGFVSKQIYFTQIKISFPESVQKCDDLAHAIWRRFQLRTDLILTDKDKEKEKLDLFQLVSGLVLMSKHPLDRKLTMLFRIHDADEDNCLTPSEIKRMIKNVDLFNQTDKYFDASNPANLKSSILVANVALAASENRLVYVMEGPGGLYNKLQEISDNIKSETVNDQDQLLDLQQLNDAFKKMPDLDTKWIAPLGKSTREILGNVDQDEPALQFSEDMVEHANNLRQRLHRDMFKGQTADDFVFKDTMPLTLQPQKAQGKFFIHKHKKDELKEQVKQQKNPEDLYSTDYTSQVLEDVRLKCEALKKIDHLKLNLLDGGIRAKIGEIV